MDQGLALFLGAVVAGISSVVVALVQRMRKENREDHGRVVDALGWVHSAVTRVEDKVDAHIHWHLEGDSNGRSNEGTTDGSNAA